MRISARSPKIAKASSASLMRVLRRALAVATPEDSDQRRFAGGGVLAGGLAEGRAVAFDVEQVVGDLKRLPDRRAEALERVAFRNARLAENRAGRAGELQQRAGLHRLQGADRPLVERARPAVGEASFRVKVQQLTADHAADARRARQRADQRDAHFGVRMDLRARRCFESQGQQPVSSEDGRGFVKGFVCCGTAASQVVVVHGRQVVMNERIAMDEFERRSRHQRATSRHAEQIAAGDDQQGADALAAAERGMAHRCEQAGGTLALVRARRLREQFA